LYEQGDIGAAALHWKMAAEVGKQAAIGFNVNSVAAASEQVARRVARLSNS
jgi:hypothetical protein